MYNLEKGKASDSMSSGRALIVSTLVIIVAIACLGIGLGIGVYNMIQDINRECAPTASPARATPQPTRVPTQAPPTTTTDTPTLSIDGTYRYGAVAADAAQCSTIGTDIMASGGTAVDTAIAAMLCACVHSLQSCGIGGGHFMTVYDRSQGKSYAVMGREMAPGAANATMFLSGVSSREGGLSVGIPGEIKGFWEAWKLAGNLPWAELFQPTIDLCRNGFIIGSSLGFHITAQQKYYPDHPNLKAMVSNPQTGELLKEGEVMYLPKLAATLEAIAREGPDAFYNGSLTADIVKDIQEAGGIITEEDLRMYTAAVKEPLEITIHDRYTVHSPPPPSGGAVYEFILGILDGYNFDEDSLSSREKKVLAWHRIVEAFKFAYGKRTQIGDSDVENATFKMELEELIRNMTSAAYSESIRQQITDDRTHDTPFYGPTFYVNNDAGTSHLSVLTPNGDAVSITSTVNLHFGSKEVGSRTGILFNDEMDDFSTPNTVNYFGVPASPANFIKPYKRPLSSMCPSIITDSNGDVKLVIGAAGGTKITTSTALTSIETLWFGMSMKEAIDHRRLHHQLLPKEIAVEIGFDEDVLAGLRQKGHNMTMNASAGCIVQGVLKNAEKSISGCSDYRKKASPDGF
ncbi:gamma-glutamyltranspeptidase 1-like [Mizuhopecten yessoensis]|uniref:Gamma-glutamyltranspeptidase 1 n=1 Tax=Mizuhopecten yessoensis TaxID=6573 RepID=A0A210PJB8_MIZYE|nr:gamma-glutamyltranspeptidase 1-like [Mizuhopecten yessoensis]OWF36580.1 Gamma-glutamyltranspeptidase 1 [Mizuhopecten yessoensis]